MSMDSSKMATDAGRVALKAIKGTVIKAATSVILKVAPYAIGAILIVLLVWGLFYVGVGTFTAIFGPAAYEEPPPVSSGVGTISSVEYADYINEAAQKYDVSPSLIAAVIQQESKFYPMAFNPRTEAAGLMQLIPGTAQEMGVKSVFNPKQNIMGGTKYLSLMLKKYKGDVQLALAAYNAGPGNVDKAGGIPDFAETKAYVPSVLKYKKKYDKLVKNGEIDFASGSLKGMSHHSKYPYKNASTSGVDAWKFYNRQCTSFVAWRLNDAGIKFSNYMKGGHFGNAENWARNAKKLGYKVNKTPKPGAVAQWDAFAFGHSGWGHVAYVTEIKGGKVTIEEYNYKKYNFSRREIPASQVSNYIHFK